MRSGASPTWRISSAALLQETPSEDLAQLVARSNTVSKLWRLAARFWTAGPFDALRFDAPAVSMNDLCVNLPENFSKGASRTGFIVSFFYRIPPTAGNEISVEISPNFANSERKENSNLKKKFRWIPTKISVISTEIRWFSTGKWCQLWFSYCFRGQMKNFWKPTLFSFSRSTTFV